MGRATEQYVQAASPDAISPLLLLRVLDMRSVADPAVTSSAYFVDAEEAVSFFDEDGAPEAYIPVGLSFDRVSVDNSTKVVSFRVKIDNVSRNICALAGQVTLQGCQVELLRAFREDLDSPDSAQMLIAGRIQSFSITEYSMEAEIAAPLNLPIRTPQRLYWVRCPWKFMGEECGLVAPETGLDLSNPDNAISGGTMLFYNPASAFDDDTGNSWRSSQTGTGISGVAYIGQKKVSGKVIKARLRTAGASNNVSSIKIQRSRDGVAWEDLITWAIPTTADSWQEIDLPDFTPPEQYFIRFLANANLASSTPWAVREIELIASGDACNKTVAACKGFKNIAHFGGFPHILKSRDPREVWVKQEPE